MTLPMARIEITIYKVHRNNLPQADLWHLEKWRGDILITTWKRYYEQYTPLTFMLLKRKLKPLIDLRMKKKLWEVENQHVVDWPTA